MEMQMNSQMPFTMPSPIDNSKLDKKYEQIKEIKEAFDVSEDALKHLNKSIELLYEARSWGEVDIYLGGGMATSAIKHEKIKGAIYEIQASNKAIENLKNELKDVNKIESLKLSNSTVVFDVVFDIVFADFKVQSKIKKTLNNCIEARKEISSINKELSSHLNPELLAFYYLEKDKRELSPKEFNEKQKKLINSAIPKAKNTLNLLQMTQHSINKVSDKVESNKKFFGKNFSAENKLPKARNLITDCNLSIDYLYKSLVGIHGVYFTMSEDLLKFRDGTDKIARSNDIIYENDAVQNFANAKKICSDTISCVESIIKELKSRSEKYQIEE